MSPFRMSTRPREPPLPAKESVMRAQSCETCHRPYHESRFYFYQVVLTVGVLLALLAFLGVGTLRDTVTHLEKIVSTERPQPQPTQQPQQQVLLQNKSRCDFPIVYNKPHKTASTTIQADIFRWAHAHKRPAYACSAFINQATFQMRECIPDDSSGCAVIATHVVLSPTMTRILEKKIGDFILITSTREPRARLLSMYLQYRYTRGAMNINMTDLKSWLKGFNPWTLYNYHLGENRYGGCPLAEQEKLLIPDLVNRADIVVNADWYNVSNTILRRKGLFTLSSSRRNVRSSKDLVVDEEVNTLIKNVSCVEEEMHRLYRLRMASLYEEATGKICLSNTRHPEPCF